MIWRPCGLTKDRKMKSKLYVSKNGKMIKTGEVMPLCKTSQCKIPADFICANDKSHLFCAKHAPCTLPVSKERKCPICQGDLIPLK